LLALWYTNAANVILWVRQAALEISRVLAVGRKISCPPCQKKFRWGRGEEFGSEFNCGKVSLMLWKGYRNYP